MNKFVKLLFIIVCLIVIEGDSLYAEEPYPPSKSSLECAEILDALNEGFIDFPDKYTAGFEYLREEVKSKPDRITFNVKYMKVMGDWAYVEADLENWCCASTLALLYKENSKWTVKGIVNPRYVVCEDIKACLDVKAYLYKKFKEQFPSVASEIFPEVHPSRKAILSNSVSASKYIIFVVDHFKEKNGWAWIETSPRSTDGIGQLEPINGLYKKEKGKWKCIESQPCCGEYEEHPGVRKYGDFISYLKHKYPQVPKEIFEK